MVWQKEEAVGASARNLFAAVETQSLQPAYLRRLCQYSKRFGVKHVIAMTGEWDQYTLFEYKEFGFKREPWEYAFARRKQAAVRKAMNLVHSCGMRFHVWRHELSMHPEHMRSLNPKMLDFCYGRGNKLGRWGEGRIRGELGFFDPRRKELWKYVTWRFQHLFALFPKLDGVVLTCLTETKLPLWNLCQEMGKAEILAELLKIAVRECRRRGKQLIVRNWGAYRDPKNPQGEVLLDALDRIRAPQDILFMEKSIEPDFALGYPPHPGVAQAAARRATLVELELENETEGMCTVPVCCPEESQIAIKNGRQNGCAGYVLRVDGSPDTTQWWHAMSALENANEINLYAALRLLKEPDAPLAGLWQDWARERFGRKAGPAVVELLRPTLDLGLKTYCCQGNITNSNHLSLERAQVNHAAYPRHLYTGLPADRRSWEVLGCPTESDLAACLTEKEAAIGGYEQGLRQARRLRGRIPARWSRELEASFRMAVDVAIVNRHFLEAVLRYQRWRQGSADERPRIGRAIRRAETHLRRGRFPKRDEGTLTGGHLDFVEIARANLRRFRERLRAEAKPHRP